MAGIESARIALDSSGDAWLEILVIPRFRNVSPPALIDASTAADDGDLSAVQLIESTEYRYRLIAPSPGPFTTNRTELFEADDASGCSGRIKTGLHVGSVPIEVYQNGEPIGRITLEVRSRKLEYRSEYQWMLRDIAEDVAEIVMERFAPSEHVFRPDEHVDSRTAYQRFAFLKALLDDEAFAASLRRIAQRPYVAWDLETEQRLTSQGVRASSRLAREITRATRGQGYELPSGHRVPETVVITRPVESLDNVPNRFVAFALRRWLDVIETIRQALQYELDTPQKARGLAETDAVRAVLESVLLSSALRDVGELAQLPTNNTVLLTRAGYREMYRAFIELEMAARIGWRGGDSVYGAGQKNVAALYEYWAFVQLAECLAEVCGRDFSLGQLIEPSDDQLSVRLTRGEAASIRGMARRGGRDLRVELWFNRTFSERDRNGGSWSRPMRPDCSLLIQPVNSVAGDAGPIWLHFDAKYRIEALSDIFSDDDAEQPTSRSKRDDLLKMHAYRDAIRRSAGAYVLYPGHQRQSFREYHELLPGLGAFALRPAESGEVLGRDTLRVFLEEVIDHVASQTTQHERGRYWARRIFSKPLSRHPTEAVDFLTRPPADTPLLLCYAKSPEHFEWIREQRLYNIRADDRRGSLAVESPELAAELILVYSLEETHARLYRVDGSPVLLTSDDLATRLYPTPRGRLYFCLPVEPIEMDLLDLRIVRVTNAEQHLRGDRPFGQPIPTDWASFVDAMNLDQR